MQKQKQKHIEEENLDADEGVAMRKGLETSPNYTAFPEYLPY